MKKLRRVELLDAAVQHGEYRYIMHTRQCSTMLCNIDIYRKKTCSAVSWMDVEG